jgi:ribulose-5-phosphate 4-epimerase/fuculose-1-phosphate aldolase
VDPLAALAQVESGRASIDVPLAPGRHRNAGNDGTLAPNTVPRQRLEVEGGRLVPSHDRNDRATPSASSELSIHRAIYQRTRAQAIVHAHPSYSVALSLLETEITPLDAEGRLIVGPVPVVGDTVVEHVRDVVGQVASALQEGNIVLVCGHGSFAVGQLLEEAYRLTSTLEESCRLITTIRLLHGLGRDNRNRKTVRRPAKVAEAVVASL